MVKQNLDCTNRNKFLNNELKQKTFKAISLNQKLDPSLRWWAQIERSKISRRSNLCRVHNFCVQTNRSRSIIGFYKLSRLRLRRLASKNLIPGLRKSSW